MQNSVLNTQSCEHSFWNSVRMDSWSSSSPLLFEAAGAQPTRRLPSLPSVRSPPAFPCPARTRRGVYATLRTVGVWLS